MTRKPLPKVIKPAGTASRTIPVEPEIEAPIPQRPAPRPPLEAQDIWSPSPPPANDPLPVATQPASPAHAEARLRAAFKLVERHKFYAGLGGVVPMAAVNVVSVTAVNLRMVKLLSDLYEVPFQREKTRSIILGLMGGATPTGLAAATASTLSFAVPVAGAFGLVVSTVAAAVLTRRIGLHFVERFEQDAAHSA
jgi:uncharacterized protein (DUF697 family)